MAPGRWGWTGGMGTCAYVDPSRDAVSVLLTQRCMTGPDDGPEPFWAAVAEAASGDEELRQRALAYLLGLLSKPRHQFVYTSADSSRPCRSDISLEISMQRFAHVQSVFCLYTAYLLVERRFLRYSRLHSAYM